jgi:hypothetical protein
VDRKELERNLDILWTQVGHQLGQGGVPDPPTVNGLVLVGEALLALDKTSGELATTNNKLARANVCIGVVLAVIALVQVFLMVRGH